MRIVVLGGTGMVGSKVVAEIEAQGHDAVAASPSRGVNAYTSEGLLETLAGADAVIDVVNAPSWADDAVLDFFQTSTHNLLAAVREAGVSHLVAISIVGSRQMPGSGYMRAKVAQEDLLAASDAPYTIVQATQFYEFIGGMVAAFADAEGTLRVPPIAFQPMAAADVARALVHVATGAPQRTMLEIGGPEVLAMDATARQHLAQQQDAREVVTDAGVTYFGAPATAGELTTRPGAWLAEQTYAQWLAATTAATAMATADAAAA